MQLVGKPDEKLLKKLGSEEVGATQQDFILFYVFEERLKKARVTSLDPRHDFWVLWFDPFFAALTRDAQSWHLLVNVALSFFFLNGHRF